MKRPRRLGTSPQRIALGDRASLETRLVREAQREAPPAGASTRALVALGLATTAGAAASTVARTAEAGLAKATVAKAAAAEGVVATVAGAKASSALATAAAPVAATKGLFGLSLTTWLAGGAVAIATTVGVVRISSDASAPTAPSAPVAPTVASAAPHTMDPGTPDLAPAPPPAPAEREVAPVGAPSGEPARLPSPPRSASRISASSEVPPPVTSETAPQTPAPVASTLGREVALVDGARAALAGGDPAKALSLLDTYDREFPQGTLAPESARVRTKALAAAKSP